MTKRLILILLVAWLANSLAFAQSNLVPKEKPVGAKAAWERTSYDFGDIPEGVPVSTTFKFTNTGSTPLIISEVKTSCGCTTPFYTKDPIMPGESGVIKAQYTAGSAGAFNKSITVTTNSPEVPKQNLYIKGVVVAKEK